MRALSMIALVLLLVVGFCESSFAQAPATEELAMGLAALTAAVASGAMIIANLNYSPDGHGVMGVLGTGVGVATVAAGLWWLGESDNRRADVTGSVIVTAGVFAVYTGLRSVVQASHSRSSSDRTAIVLPAFQPDESGDVKLGVVAVFHF